MHWLVVIAIALVVFGPKRLPELGRNLGAGIHGFKDSLEGKEREGSAPQPEDAQPSDPESAPPSS